MNQTSTKCVRNYDIKPDQSTKRRKTVKEESDTQPGDMFHLTKTNKEQLIEKYGVSKENIDFYKKNGYVVLKGVFDSTKLANINGRLDSIQKHAEKLASVESKKYKPGDRFRQEFAGVDGDTSNYVATIREDGCVSVLLVSWVGGSDDVLKQYGRCPELTVPVAQLLGVEFAIHLINQLHSKQEGDGNKFDLHDDMGNRVRFNPEWYDVLGNGSFVQTLVAITKSNRSNGGIIIVPGLHNRELALYKHKTPEEKIEAINKAVSERYGEGKMYKDVGISVDMEPGDLLIMDPFVPHYSEANISGKKRYLFINGFSAEGTAQEFKYPGKKSAQLVSLIPAD